MKVLNELVNNRENDVNCRQDEKEAKKRAETKEKWKEAKGADVNEISSTILYVLHSHNFLKASPKQNHIIMRKTS